MRESTERLGAEPLNQDPFGRAEAGPTVARRPGDQASAGGRSTQDLQYHTDADQQAIRDLQDQADDHRQRICDLQDEADSNRATIRDLEEQANVDRALIAVLQAEGEVDRSLISNLEEALVTARRIGAAMGVLMASHRVTDAQAFDLLCKGSQHTNRKLRDIADEVVLTGTMPKV